MKNFIFSLSLGFLLIGCSLLNESENQKKAEFDNRLIGRWTYTQSSNHDDFWFVTKHTMVITADGNVTVFEPVSHSHSSDFNYISPSQEKVVLTFPIITKGGNMHVLNPETGQENFLAKYEISGNSMVAVGADGVRILWEKG